MEQEQYWKEVFGALADVAAGATYRLQHKPRLGRPSVLELTAETLTIVYNERASEFSWASIGYIGFPPTRRYVNSTAVNRFIYLFLIKGGVESTGVVKFAKLLLGIDKRSEGDVLIPNATATLLGDNCYGGFKQWQLLLLLQQFHGILTGCPYTNQDFNYGLLKEKDRVAFEPVVHPQMMEGLIQILQKNGGDEASKKSRAAILLAAMMKGAPRVRGPEGS